MISRHFLRISIKSIFFWLLITCLCTSLSPQTFGQDTHHWNNQFGTRAALLGGAVLTDTIDNAGVFYNPANLAFLDTSSISINANLYGIETIEIENALGQRESFNGLQFNSVPLLISGTIKSKSTWNISYALVTPVSFKFNEVARIEGEVNLIDEDESPGNEELVAESGLNTKVQETSLLIGVGKEISNRLGFGLSLINTLRSIDYNYRFNAKGFTNAEDPILISWSRTEFVDYWSLNTALKAGFNYQGNSYGLALTVTTPGLRLGGNGKVAKDITVFNIELEDQPGRFSGYGSARQEKLKANYKTPFQISFGGHKQINRANISLNVTHFGGVDLYRIIEVESGPFIRPPSLGANLGPENFLNVETAMESVTNFAVGYEGFLGKSFKIFGSFRTDLSYFDQEPTLGNQIVTEFTQWNIYHLSAGTILEKERSSLTLGLVYGFGSTDGYFQRNAYDPNEPSTPLDGALTITEARYSNIGLLIGYSFRFKKFN